MSSPKMHARVENARTGVPPKLPESRGERILFHGQPKLSPSFREISCAHISWKLKLLSPSEKSVSDKFSSNIPLPNPLRNANCINIVVSASLTKGTDPNLQFAMGFQRGEEWGHTKSRRIPESEGDCKGTRNVPSFEKLSKTKDLEEIGAPIY